MVALHDHFVKLVIPFEYSMGYSEAISAIRASQCWESNKRVPRDMFLHIKHLISSEATNNSIGANYVLSTTGRSTCNFPLLKDQAGVLLKKGSGDPELPDFEIKFTVPEVYLFLFETQVGFIALDIKYIEPGSLEVIEMANHQLKKIGLSRSFICRDGEKPEKAKKGIGFFDRFFESLKPLVSLVSFFEEQDRMLRHLYLFNYLILDHLPESDTEKTNFIFETLFRLRNGFHAHYYPSKKEFDPESNSQVLSFVHNIFWGVSQEGVACVAYLTGDFRQTHFLTQIFKYNVENSYFYLYILAMAQRFSLLIIAKKTADIPLEITGSIDELKNKKEIICTIDALRQDIVLYGLRINYSQVSYNFHYTLFYEKLRDVFRLDYQHTELDTEVKNLGALIDIIEQKKRINFELNAAVALLVFAVVSVLSDGLSFFQFMNFFNTQCPFLSLTGLILIVAIILMFVRHFLKKDVLYNIRKR